MKEFNKKLCLANIYYLAKQKNIKIGDLESAAGVSAGYISRLNKPDTKTSPSLEMLITVADMLGVTLDSLLHRNHGDLTPTEKYVVDFLDKLTEKTNSRSEIWRRDSYAKLSHIGQDAKGRIEHPLFSWHSVCDNSATGYPDEYSYIGYSSIFREAENVDVCDDGFVLPFNGRWLYLMKVAVRTEMDDRGNDVHYEYELYMVNGSREVSVVCHSTWDEESPYNMPLEILYKAAADSSKHPILTHDVRNAIDDFMNVEELPF